MVCVEIVVKNNKKNVIFETPASQQENIFTRDVKQIEFYK